MRRRVVMILMLLLLGAAVNIAIAWGFAFDNGMYDLVEPPTEGYPLHMTLDMKERLLWMAFVHAKPGRYGVEVFQAEEVDEIIEREMTTEAEVLSLHEEYRAAGTPDLPSWSAVRSLRSFAAMRLRVERETLSDRAFGWPLPALACHWHSQFLDNSAIWERTVAWGLPLSETDAPQAQGFPFVLNLEVPRVLPLRPILPGFILNSLMYAAALWLFFAAPFTLRRTLRRRRGVCVKCAYPIGVSPVCMECGAAVARRSQTHPQ